MLLFAPEGSLTIHHIAAALVEALMGFQFNHVGGGTKTRRPITLHMKYNAACVQPHCFLITEDYGEQEVTLEELQVSFCSNTCAASLLATQPAVIAVHPALLHTAAIHSNLFHNCELTG